MWPRVSIDENEAIDASRVPGLIFCYFPCTKLHLPLRFHTMSRFQLVLNIHVSPTHRAIVRLPPPPRRKLSALTCRSPFLAFVSNIQQFDDRLKVYTTSNYVQLKYVEFVSLSRRQLTSASGTSSFLAVIMSISKTPRTSMPDIQPA